MSNESGVEPQLDFSDCHEYTDSDLELLDSLSFYVEAVIQTPTAICGLVCNLATCVVLASKVTTLLSAARTNANTFAHLHLHPLPDGRFLLRIISVEIAQ